MKYLNYIFVLAILVIAGCVEKDITPPAALNNSSVDSANLSSNISVNLSKVYTTSELKEASPNLINQTVKVTGEVIYVSYCPPCPKGAMCTPCPTEQIRLTDGKNEISILFDSEGREYHKVLKEGDTITLEINIEQYGGSVDQIQYVFVKSVEHVSSDSQTQKFLEAGCYYSNGDLNCENASFASEFKCESYMSLAKYGESLDPKLVLLECPVVMQDYTVGDYFNCDGGFIYTCLSYVTFDNNKFVNIKNPEEFAAVFAPVESEEEALDFALLSYDGLDKVQNKSGVLFEAKSEKSGENFAVTIYSRSSQFGCYSDIQYYGVTYEVTKNGSITEKNRETVYTEDLGYLICVD